MIFKGTSRMFLEKAKKCCNHATPKLPIPSLTVVKLDTNNSRLRPNYKTTLLINHTFMPIDTALTPDPCLCQFRMLCLFVLAQQSDFLWSSIIKKNLPNGQLNTSHALTVTASIELALHLIATSLEVAKNCCIYKARRMRLQILMFNTVMKMLDYPKSEASTSAWRHLECRPNLLL